MENRKIKIVFVQNIFTPYRTYLYNTLFKKGLNLKVFYQSLSESDRNWNVDFNKIKHPFWIDKCGLYFRIFNYHLHINPVMFFRLLILPKECEIQLPGWDDGITIFMCILKKLGIVHHRLSITCEANYLEKNGKKSNRGLKAAIKRFVIAMIDGYVIIPGRMAIESIKHYGGDVDKLHFLNLPNIIEDDTINEINYPQHIDVPVFITPARLVENLKGIKNFFTAIGLDNIRKCKFLIAGDGEDYGIYKKFIDEHDLSNNIELLGFLTSEEMNEVYSKAHVMLLPSFYDPSPLTLVEATKVGLPILCSNHCGNHYECVESGINGETFDPCDKVDIKEKFELMLSNIERWKTYSERSKELYKERFSPDVVLNNVIAILNG